jgi:hypothetical protein
MYTNQLKELGYSEEEIKKMANGDFSPVRENPTTYPSGDRTS